MTLNKIAFGCLFFFAGFALGGLLYYEEPPTGSHVDYQAEELRWLQDNWYSPEEVEALICAEHEFPICETYLNQPLTF